VHSCSFVPLTCTPHLIDVFSTSESIKLDAGQFSRTTALLPSLVPDSDTEVCCRSLLYMHEQYQRLRRLTVCRWTCRLMCGPAMAPHHSRTGQRSYVQKHARQNAADGSVMLDLTNWQLTCLHLSGERPLGLYTTLYTSGRAPQTSTDAADCVHRCKADVHTDLAAPTNCMRKC
jgi:hypothetical protein